MVSGGVVLVLPSSEPTTRLTIGRAQPGDVVVARPGGVLRIAGAGPAGDVVEVARVLVQDVHDLLGAAAVEGRLAGGGPTLVGDRQDRRPLRRAGAGAADRHPAELVAVIVGIRVVHGVLRCSARRRRRRRGWPASSWPVSPRRTGTTAAARRRWGRRRCRSSRSRCAQPPLLAEGQRRAADGQDVRRGRRPLGRGAAVARGHHERHAGVR